MPPQVQKEAAQRRREEISGRSKKAAETLAGGAPRIATQSGPASSGSPIGATKEGFVRRTKAKSVKISPKTKDPRGGLTAAGRREFARKEGSHLRPGVKKSQSEMTAEDMRRKGSWAVRFYGRSGGLPPLQDKHGNPTRFALTAAAWGEPVPKTVAAARKIGSKGKRLLDLAKRRIAE